MTGTSLTADSTSLSARRAAAIRWAATPGYYLALALALGVVAIVAASQGASGLALFAGAHMLLGLAAAGWRVQEAGGPVSIPTSVSVPVPAETRAVSPRLLSEPGAPRA